VRLTRFRTDPPPDGLHVAMPEEDTFFAILQLRDHPPHDFWLGGQVRRTLIAPKGCLHIADLNGTPRALLREPVDSLHLELPRAALDDLAEEVGAFRMTELHVPEPWQTRDPRLASLQEAVLSALEASEAAPPLFTGHLLLAMAFHVCETYGGLQRRVIRTGGLAPWQERRARDLIASELGPKVALGDVANECGLSMSHFCKAFKVSTGLTPHGWLQRCRLDRARDLLRRPAHSLAEVSLQCGFADQSHLNRIFRREIGVTPGVWRRDRLN
jgi:AraC-like DNA-binding protein